MSLAKLPIALLIILLVTTHIITAQYIVDVDALCIVTRVIDGDTVDVVIVRVFDEKYSMLSGREVRVRFADINAPEIYTTEDKAAKDFLYSLVQGKYVYLDIDDLYVYDRYGRIVAVVYLPVNNTTLLNVNLYLVVKGYAEITDYPNEFYPATWKLYIEENTTTSQKQSATTKTVTITHVHVTTKTVEKTVTKTTYTTITVTKTKTQQTLITQKETITVTQTITITTQSSQNTSSKVNQIVIIALVLSIALNIALLYKALKKR